MHRRAVLAGIAVVAAVLAAAPAGAYPLAPANPTSATLADTHTATLPGEALPTVVFTGSLAPQEPYQQQACRRVGARLVCSWVYHVPLVEASCASCWIPPVSSTVSGHYGRTYAQCSGSGSLDQLAACAWAALATGRLTMVPGDSVRYASELQGSGTLDVVGGDGSVYHLDVP